MKIIYSICTVLYCMTSFAQSFEGTITQKVKDFTQDDEYTMVWYFKGNQVALNIRRSAGSPADDMMFLPGSGNDIFIFSNQKSSGENYYFKGTASDAKQTYSKVITTRSEADLSGFQTQNYVLKGSDLSEMDMWFSEDISVSFKSSMTKFSGKGSFEHLSDLPDTGFPLEYINRVNGQITTSVELVEVSEKSLSDAFFSIPSGYKEAPGVNK